VTVLEPERAAALLAERLGRPGPAGVPAPAPDGPALPDDALPSAVAGLPCGPFAKEWLVQRTLEELGIHLEANGALQDLKGFLIASPRGAEIVVSDRLDAEERLAVYAHLLAHAVLEEAPEKPDGLLGLLCLPVHTLQVGAPGAPGVFFSHLEYVEARGPRQRSRAERYADGAAAALAQAILRGRLDGVPQYAYRRTRGPVRNTGLRAALGRMWLELSHRTSLALFWLSPKYRRLRSRQDVTQLVHLAESLTRAAYAC
jgi:hypothetical protein